MTVAALAALGGCSTVMGDLGRAERGPFSSEVIPAAAAKTDAQGKVKVTALALTEAERQMRDRIWRFLKSPHAYDWFAEAANLLQGAGHVSQLPSTDKYYVWLGQNGFVSTAAKYNRLFADINDDLETLPATLDAICAVDRLDRQRGMAANQLNLEDSMNAGAAARFAENRDLERRFTLALGNRYDSYSYALTHLLVEAPDEMARGVDAALSQLAVPLEKAEQNTFCDATKVPTSPLIVDDQSTDLPRSRYSLSG